MPRKTDESSQSAKFELLLEIIPDIVYRVDTEGYFTFVSSCIRNLGWEPEELLGQHFSAIIHPNDVERVSRRVVLARHKGVQTGEKSSPKLFDERRTGERMTRWLEVRLIPKDWNPQQDGTTCRVGSLISVGEVASTGLFSQPIKTSDKEFVGSVGIIRDITDRKKDEEERRQLEQQYAQAQRLESLGLLAGGIAHDFKNLLTIATGYIEVAIERSSSDQTVALYLEKAMNALQRSKTLTQQLLGFSKGPSPKKSAVDVIAVTKNTVGLAMGETDAYEVTYTFGKGLWSVYADEGQIAQVIDNVIINARHAMPNGGKLGVEVRNLPDDDLKQLPIPPGDYVEIIVSDSGIGIREEDLPKIFDPFFTTKQDGSGLGLATSFFVVKKHHGHIAIESELGKGTTVRVLLPADAQSAPTKAPSGRKTKKKPS